ncbi:flagellin [Escherichia sp. E2562]|nr:flagellin [Escherichia sp. E2562]
MTDFNVAGGINAATLNTTGANVNVDEGYKYDVANVTDKGAKKADNIVKDDATGKIYAQIGTDADPANNKYYEIKDDGKGGMTFDSTGAATGFTKATAPTSVKDQEAYHSTQVTGVPAGTTLKDDGKGNYYLEDATGNLTNAKLDTTNDKAGNFTATITDLKTAVNTKPATTDPLKAIDAALSQVDKLRSGLGAVQNRFDSVISNLNNTVNNLSESRSRILDADFASEVSNMSRANILQSAGTSVLAQANQVPQNVLQLLR